MKRERKAKDVNSEPLGNYGLRRRKTAEDLVIEQNRILKSLVAPRMGHERQISLNCLSTSLSSASSTSVLGFESPPLLFIANTTRATLISLKYFRPIKSFGLKTTRKTKKLTATTLIALCNRDEFFTYNSKTHKTTVFRPPRCLPNRRINVYDLYEKDGKLFVVWSYGENQIHVFDFETRMSYCDTKVPYDHVDDIYTDSSQGLIITLCTSAFSRILVMSFDSKQIIREFKLSFFGERYELYHLKPKSTILIISSSGVLPLDYQNMQDATEEHTLKFPKPIKPSVHITGYIVKQPSAQYSNQWDVEFFPPRTALIYLISLERKELMEVETGLKQKIYYKAQNQVNNWEIAVCEKVLIRY